VKRYLWYIGALGLILVICSIAYSVSAEPTVSDDFEYADGPPSPDVWEIDRGSPEVVNGELYSENVGYWDGDLAMTKNTFVGDQDAQFRVLTPEIHSDQTIFLFILDADGNRLMLVQDDAWSGDGNSGLTASRYSDGSNYEIRSYQLDHDDFETCYLELRGTVLTVSFSGGGQLVVDIGTNAIRYELGSWATVSGRYSYHDDFSVTLLGGNVPPTADAGPDQSALVDETVFFNGSGSTDLDGNITFYKWNFGDGGLGYGASVSHSYAVSGVYDVVLTVYDDNNGSDQDTCTVRVFDSPPTFYDNFTAADGSPPNPDFWVIDRGSAEISDNMLFSQNVGYWDGDLTMTKDTFVGDQDAQFWVRTLDITTDQTIFLFILDTNGDRLLLLQDDAWGGDGTIGVTASRYSDAKNFELRSYETDHVNGEMVYLHLRGTVLSISLSGGGQLDVDIGTNAIRYELGAWATVSGRDAWHDDFEVHVLEAPNQPPAANLQVSTGVDVVDGERVNVELRVAGEKWHEVTLEVLEDGVVIGSDNVTRLPGSPDEQTVNVSYVNAMGSVYVAVINYRAVEHGQTPAWLTVTCAGRSDTQKLNLRSNATKQQYVEIELNPMFDDMFWDIIYYDASGSTDPDGTITSHHWDFGDGGTSDAVSGEYVYADRGSYTITLTVTDDDGAQANATYVISINMPLKHDPQPKELPYKAPKAKIIFKPVGTTLSSPVTRR